MTRKIIIPNLDDLLRRYIAGESENALANEAGVNRWTFRRRLIETGIQPRNQSESERAKWTRMSESQRTHQVKSAHSASRGRTIPIEVLIKRAKSLQGSRTYNVAPEEIVLGNWLHDAGLTFIHNFAIGPYNCDLGLSPITVEIWGGSWHPKPIEIKRTKYILDSGYWLLYITLDKRRFPLSRSVTKNVIALFEFACANPTATREYWMIRGDGELIFKRLNSDNITLKPSLTSSRNSTDGQDIRVPR